MGGGCSDYGGEESAKTSQLSLLAEAHVPAVWTHRSSFSKSEGSLGLLLTTLAVPSMYCTLLEALVELEVEDESEELSLLFQTPMPAPTPLYN